MSPKKLTEDDKSEILKLYRETPATTSTLADQYGVSSSTVSRFLKNHLSDTEYEELIQQKRLARTAKSEEEADFYQKQTSLALYLTTIPEDQPQKENRSHEPAPVLDFSLEISQKEEKHPFTAEKNQEEPPQPPPPEEPIEEKPRPILRRKSESPLEIMAEEPEIVKELEEESSFAMTAVGEMLGEDLLDLEDEDDLDEDWEDEDDLDEDYAPSLANTGNLQILPLASANFPSTCYLVIDRMAELITCPLREFTHLGSIPDEEVYQRTLPIFDNHRVARRFSKRSQRVIKVPDGKILKKTSSHLEAKGITRILLDGQIYALSGNWV